MENIKNNVDEFNYVIGYDDEFDFKLKEKRVEQEKEFNPKLNDFYPYNAINLLIGTKDDPDFDFVLNTINDSEFDFVLSPFSSNENYIIDSNFDDNKNDNYEDLTIEDQRRAKKEKELKKELALLKFKKSITAIAVALGISAGTVLSYLFIKSAQATAIVDERHGAKMVDNAGTVIYKDEEPTKEEYDEVVRYLITSDIENIKEFFVNIGNAIIGR